MYLDGQEDDNSLHSQARHHGGEGLRVARVQTLLFFQLAFLHLLPDTAPRLQNASCQGSLRSPPNIEEPYRKALQGLEDGTYF